MPAKNSDIETVIAEMRASAERNRGLMRRPIKPLLVLPEGWRDVTEQAAGKTFALIGAPRATRPKE